jgi:hypothetical protein
MDLDVDDNFFFPCPEYLGRGIAPGMFSTGKELSVKADISSREKSNRYFNIRLYITVSFGGAYFTPH